jgi:hypothetical protein
MSDDDEDRDDRMKGPFVASEEKTVDGLPVGVEVGGGRDTGHVGRGTAPGTGPGGTTGGPTGADRKAPPPKDYGPIDETGRLDDEGETRRNDPRDIHDRDDLRSTEDRIDDHDSW